MDIRDLADHGFDLKEGISHTGNEDLYVKSLGWFYNAYEKTQAALSDSLKAGDAKEFNIAVHALKSTSRLIGATELSEEALRLENLSRENECAVFEEDASKLLLMYKDVIDQIGLYVSTVEKPKEVKLIGMHETLEILEELKKTLDICDDITALELVKKLDGFLFTPALREKVDKAAEYIDELMYDEAYGLTEEIYAELSGSMRND